jgi:hypothetical protein
VHVCLHVSLGPMGFAHNVFTTADLVVRTPPLSVLQQPWRWPPRPDEGPAREVSPRCYCVRRCPLGRLVYEGCWGIRPLGTYCTLLLRMHIAILSD